MINMLKFIDPNANIIPAKNVYGGAGGPSLGTASSGLNSYSAQAGGVSETATMEDGANGVDGAAATGMAGSPALLGRPVTWWLVLLVVVLGVMMLAKKYSGGEGGNTFAAIKPTVYNMFAITGNAVIGIVLLKVLFNKVQVPGLTPLINAV